ERVTGRDVAAQEHPGVRETRTGLPPHSIQIPHRLEGRLLGSRSQGVDGSAEPRVCAARVEDLRAGPAGERGGGRDLRSEDVRIEILRREGRGLLWESRERGPP